MKTSGRKLTGALLAAAATLLPACAFAADYARAAFGKTPDGVEVEAITLTNGKGVSATVITYGATLQSLIAPGRDGTKADIALGFKDAEAYVKNASYFGASVGRFANRIGKGKFTLDGKTYQLALNNNGVAALHGGVKGFDKLIWKVSDIKRGPVASVTFTYVSPDGEEGYPGTVTATATYALDEKNDLTVSYGAVTDKPTIVNMTNHAIFDLGGEGSPMGAMGHKLTMPAKAYTPVNPTLIPTGELRAVAGTVFDFRKPRVLAAGLRDGRDEQIVAGRGYDHNFAIDAGLTAEPKLAARLEDPVSGRVLEVLSTEPGLQLYTGNFLDGTLVGKHGHVYRMGDGVAMEPQKFPDTPNQPAFGSARVDPGKPYRHLMIYRVSVAPR